MFLVACFHVTHVMGGDYWRGVLVLPKMPFACQNPMGGEGGDYDWGCQRCCCCRRVLREVSLTALLFLLEGEKR